MAFTETKALDIYYGSDRIPRDVDGNQIEYVGTDYRGSHLSSEIRFHFLDDDIAETATVTIIAKEPSGSMRFDICERVVDGDGFYYSVELNNWYFENFGKLQISVKVYIGDVDIDEETLVITPAAGTKIITGAKFFLEVPYVPNPTTQVSADELSTLENILANVASRPIFSDVIRVVSVLPDLDVQDEEGNYIYDGRRFLVVGENSSVLYRVNDNVATQEDLELLLSSLKDVNITTPLDDDVLVYDGEKWVNTDKVNKAIGDEDGTNIKANYVRLGDIPNVAVLDESGLLPNSYLQSNVPLLDENDKLDNAWLKDDVPLIDTKTANGVVFWNDTLGKLDTYTRILVGASNDEIILRKLSLIDDTNTFIRFNATGSSNIELNTNINNSIPTIIINNANASSTGNIAEFWSNLGAGPVWHAKIEKDGTFVTRRNVELGGDLLVTGDIIQQGSAYETHAEHIYTTKDHIILRDGAVSGLAVGAYAGLFAKLADGTNDAGLVFDGSGMARVGDISYSGSTPVYTNTQALATRQDTPTSNGVPYWNADTWRFDTSSGLVSDLGDNANAGLLINKSAGAGNIAEFKFNAANKLEITKDGFITQNGTSILSVSATNRNAIGLGAVASDNNSVVLGNTNITKTILRGNVGINQTSPTSQLHIVSSAVDKVGLIVDMPASATANIQQWKVNGNNVAYISSGGTMLAGAFSTSGGLLNSSSYTNAYVEVLTTGTKISRNIADANTALIVDLANGSSTGWILDLRKAGTSKVAIDNNGDIRTLTGISNRTSKNNSNIEVSNDGTLISRNIADANSALIVNQANASSTGKLLDLQFNGTSKAYFDKDGNINIASGAKYKINGTDLAASDVGAVPTTRTVNGHALSSDITLTYDDVKPTETLLGSRTSTGSLTVSDIDNFDEIILEFKRTAEVAQDTYDKHLSRVIVPISAFSDVHGTTTSEGELQTGAFIVGVEKGSGTITSAYAERSNSDGTSLSITIYNGGSNTWTLSIYGRTF